MGVTGLKKCYFFVYTAHGQFLEEISFDEEYWQYLTETFCRFYKEFYLDSVFHDYKRLI